MGDYTLDELLTCLLFTTTNQFMLKTCGSYKLYNNVYIIHTKKFWGF